MSKGYALVGDLGRFEIDDVYLERGLVWIRARSEAIPQSGGGTFMVRLFSDDGQVVGIMKNVEIPAWNLGPYPGTMWIEFSMSLQSRLPGEPYMKPIME